MSDEDLAWRQTGSHWVQVIESFAGRLSGALPRGMSCGTVKTKGHTGCTPVNRVTSTFSSLTIKPSPSSLQSEQAPHFTSRETEARWRRVVSMKSHEMGGTTTDKAQDWELRHPAFTPTSPSLVSSGDRETKLFRYGH